MAKTAEIAKTNTIRLKFPFNRDILDRIKKLSNRKWVADVKAWDVTVDFRNCFELERIINDEKFLSSSEIQKIIDFFKAEAKDMVNGVVKNEYPILEVPERVKNAMIVLGKEVRPYQIEGFSHMVYWKKAINGCEMGLGKTLQTLIAIEYLNSFPALIICPATLKQNWADEINKFLPGRTSVVIDSKTLIYNNKDFYIINYDILKNRAKDLDKINFKSVALDECQYIKNKKAQRSEASIKIVKKIPYAYLLSGTLIENGPWELISQIEAIGRMADLGGYWSFINRYCDAKSNGFGLNITGSKNIEELHLRMAKTFYFRRNKKEVAKELPDKIYSRIIVEIDNRKEYDYAENQLVDYLQNKVFEKKQFKEELKGLTKEEKAELTAFYLADQEEKVNNAEHLVLMSTLRKITAQGKIKAAKEWVTNFLESSDEKILIFGWHTEVVETIAKEFNCEMIMGGVAVKERQEIVNRFQNDPKIRVLSLNIIAGGVGLNLQKSSTVLFLEEPYNPAKKLQAEDRSHRIGQENTVNVYTMTAMNTIDDEIYELVQEKLKVVNAVNAGDFIEESSDLNILKELIKKMSNR